MFFFLIQPRPPSSPRPDTPFPYTTLCRSSAAHAHSFGRIYNLPVPFWMYAYGATAALLLSFLVFGYFVSAGHAQTDRPPRDVTSRLRPLRRVIPVLQGLSVFVLLLCIVTGLFGSRDPYRNINMTCFWVLFLLGFSYLSALLGDLYALLNPLQLIARGIGRVWPAYARGRLRYPAKLAYWPALGFYMMLIWVELFAHTTDRKSTRTKSRHEG